MNKNIKLAVAGAILATASVANAGILIPAGDWTVDISGNVNAYMNETQTKGAAIAGGALASGTAANLERTKNNLGTGLLPNFMSIGASSRQNDLDVSFLISFNPGGYTVRSGNGGSVSEQRQSFMTFGDKSWGSIKIGKDLGIFASDAILNDMTLLGVGSGGGSRTTGDTTSLGRIGTGFLYADWKEQISYTTPNMSGFQATAGITQAYNTWDGGATRSLATTNQGGATPAIEGKASYSFAANDITGKIWVSGFAQKIDGLGTNLKISDTAQAGDIGANVNVAGFGLTGYYYNGTGVGTTFMLRDALDLDGNARDSDGGYVQATYVLPTKTKVGISWGESNLDKSDAETASATQVKKNEMWSAGVYHPLTKSVNLVAEYNHVKSESQTGTNATTNGASLGAILFF